MMQKKIEMILEKQARPYLLQHEGNVEILDYREGVLKVRLTGQCSGCPSAAVTAEGWTVWFAYSNLRMQPGLPGYPSGQCRGLSFSYIGKGIWEFLPGTSEDEHGTIRIACIRIWSVFKFKEEQKRDWTRLSSILLTESISQTERPIRSKWIRPLALLFPWETEQKVWFQEILFFRGTGTLERVPLARKHQRIEKPGGENGDHQQWGPDRAGKHTGGSGRKKKGKRDRNPHIDLKAELQRIELQYMEQAYKTYGSVREAAASLGMTAPTFVRKRKQYNI